MPTRQTHHPHWPRRWIQRHGAIYYQTRPSDRAKWDGKTWFKLGRSEPEAWTTWYKRTKQPKGAVRTVDQAIDRFIAEELPKRAEKTQTEYIRAFSNLRPSFGHMLIEDLEPIDVYAYMDHRPAVTGNREKSALSAVFTCAVRWGCIKRNLVREVVRNPEPGRTRYVENQELAAFEKHCNPMLRAYIELKMLTGLRQGQILDLRRTAWNQEKGALTVPGAKGGHVVRYSGEGLSEAIAALLAVQENPSDEYLLASRTGTRYTQHGFGAIFKRAMKKHVAAGGEHFTENDLRAKVASDDPGEAATKRLGHRSSATTKKFYERKPITAEVLKRD